LTQAAWKKRWLWPALIFVIALALRLAPLGRYVTPDEPAWIYRSLRFRQALLAGDWADVPATGHPGVTTMWLGAAGVQIHLWLSPDQAAARLDWLDGLAGISPRSAAAFGHLAFFLTAGRVLVALTTSLGLAGVFLLARRLWGQSVALLAALLLALDPFLAGHSGLLHLDGLLAVAMTLSALALLLFVSTGQHRWGVFSGLLGGLAVLTKTPGGFLAPFTALLLLLAWLTRRLTGRQALGASLVWGGVAALIFVALYPAMWVTPLDTLRGLLDVGERHVEGAIRPVFFHGEFTFAPDQSFYLVVWLLRISPLVLVGLPITAWVGLRRRPTVPLRLRLRLSPKAHREAWRFDALALVALAVGFGLFVTFVGKKHDRYLLPVFPLLTLGATLGIGKLGLGTPFGRVNWARRPNLPIYQFTSLFFLFLQLLLFLPYLTAPLTYFNPLVGGPRAALGWLEVDWGEGLGAAARWLNRQPDAESLIVATPSLPPFAALFNGQSVLLTADTLAQADFVVYPPVQGQNQLSWMGDSPPPVFDYHVGGVSHARLVRNPAPDQQAAYLGDQTRPGDLILLDADAALARRYTGPAELYVLADVRDAAQLAAHLETLIPGHVRLWHVAFPAASPITAQHVRGRLACYGQVESSQVAGGATISLISLNAAATCNDASRFTPYASRFNSLALIDAVYRQDPVAWPAHLFPVLRWEALAPLSADYDAVLYLIDAAGHIWAEVGQEILNADYRRPSAWTPGHWSDQTFLVPLPPAIPPGEYSVELGVLDLLTDRRLSAWDAEGNFAGLTAYLGPVTIAPPTRLPTPWDMVIPRRFDLPLEAGPFLLWGYNPSPAQAGSGERLTFDLYWGATAAPNADYSLHWRLVSGQGTLALEESAPLSPYPTHNWREGELIQARYDLPVPPELPAGTYTLTINLLDSNGAPVWSTARDLQTLEILARDRLFTLPAGIAHPLDVRLGSVAHLRGFDLGALTARPGDALSLTLYWQAVGPADRSYTVFVHLLGGDGMIYGQADHVPAGGAAPTYTWAAGQVVIDKVQLPVFADAPPGQYHIAVGMYDPAGADRLPVFDAAEVELPDQRFILPLEIIIN